MEGLEDLGCQGGRGVQRRGRNKPTSEDSQGQGDTKPGGLPMEEYTLEI